MLSARKKIYYTAGCIGISLYPMFATADIWSDSHLDIDMKNLWLDKNYTQSNAKINRVGSWSQGFDLQFTSGYTNTPIAFGLDLDAQYAYIFDSEGNDGSLPYTQSGHTPQDYSRGGATFKARYSKTELKVGDMRPELPIAWHDPARQLDTIYQGAVIESKEISNLTLTGGRFWSAVTRNSSDHENFYQYGTSPALDSKGIDFAGFNYDFNKAWRGSYFYGVVNDIYKQQYYSLANTSDLGNGFVLRTDIRWFDNTEDGQALAGKIDNRAFSGGSSISKAGHKVSFVYQRMFGDSIFPTLNGSIPQPYLLNWANQPFIRPQERSVGIGYAYDFSAAGLPGLVFSTRYIKGTDIKIARASDGSETERDISLGYVIQSGPLKGLSVDWKSFLVKQSFADDFIDNRVYVKYRWNVW